MVLMYLVNGKGIFSGYFLASLHMLMPKLMIFIRGKTKMKFNVSYDISNFALFLLLELTFWIL